MNEGAVYDKLLARGKGLFNAPAAFVEFTRVREADELLNDLAGHPHAFVLACLMDRQMRAELAWLVPNHLAEKLGTFAFAVLRRLSLEDFQDLMLKPEPLHRYPTVMSRNLLAAIELIDSRYSGNAALIWADVPTSAALVYRFLEFRGAGPKIATMAANILVRDFKIAVKDYYSIDISPDVQVQRVFKRLGLIPSAATSEQLTYRARSLHPEFPGLLDLPAWEIGRNRCRPRVPLCEGCYMNSVCPTAQQPAKATGTRSR